MRIALHVQTDTGGCGSFFAIMLKSRAFAGKSTIQAHRMVNKEIKEVSAGIHGLQVRLCLIRANIKLKTVAETD